MLICEVFFVLLLLFFYIQCLPWEALNLMLGLHSEQKRKKKSTEVCT